MKSNVSRFSVIDAVAAVQLLLGARVLLRFLGGAAADPVVRTAAVPPGARPISVVLPVLDERTRIEACLEGLIAQPAAVREILVVDGGSRDGTQAVVQRFAARDPRVRLIDAAPTPRDWNGKAWNLQTGLEASDPACEWILTVDADVVARPELAASLLMHAATSYLGAFSAAPRQDVRDPLGALVHPALLTTLVYRYGPPGYATSDPARVQATGQCFFARRALLVASEAFVTARASRCEDVSVARELARRGESVGFFEGASLADVRMYENGRECWQNWPRSLTLRDAATGDAATALGLAEVALVQALPLALAVALQAARNEHGFARAVNRGLAAARLGTLLGTRRAYGDVPWTYWLSPLADLPACVALVRSALAREHRWRGRALVPEGTLPADTLRGKVR